MQEVAFQVEQLRIVQSLVKIKNIDHFEYTFAFEKGIYEEDVEGLLKDRTIEAKKHFESILEELDELCEGVEYPRGKLEYQHYFCGESGQDEDKDEAFARLREKLYKLVGRLVRAFAELKPRMNDAGYSASEQAKLDERVSFYIALRDEIGRASGDFIDLKAYEPGMRYLIDNYIAAEDSQKIGMLDDFTLLDFILSQESKLDKPIECLEYVILHELAHLKVKNHGAEFIAILDQHLPYWRELKKQLNDSTLDYLPVDRTE